MQLKSNSKLSFMFCRTPLQSMIVSQLLDKINGEAVVVYHATSTSKKHRYYFNKIIAQRKYFIPWYNSSFSHTWNDTVAWWQIPKEIRNTKYDTLYAASFINIVFSAIRGRNPKANFYTFDDGTHNLNTVLNLEWWQYEPRNPRIVKRLLGGLSTEDIMKSIDKHYTIYDKNEVLKWTADIEEIDLFKQENEIKIDHKSRIRILLGTWTNDSVLQKKYNEVINSNKFDIFLPHPADKHCLRVSNNVGHLNNNNIFEYLIAEDVVKLIIKSGYKPIVYGFSGASLLNLHKIVPTVNIRITRSSDFDQIDDKISKMGIHTLEFGAKKK